MLTRLRCLLQMHHWRTESTDAGGYQLSCADCGKQKRPSVDSAKIVEQRKNNKYRDSHDDYGGSGAAYSPAGNTQPRPQV